jgi:hypothetical protein
MSVGSRIRKRAMKLGTKAFGALMADEKRAQRIADAFGAAQKSREALDKAQEQLLHTLGFAAKDDYRQLLRGVVGLSERIAGIERKVEALGKSK